MFNANDRFIYFDVVMQNEIIEEMAAGPAQAPLEQAPPGWTRPDLTRPARMPWRLRFPGPCAQPPSARAGAG